ncbi:MAG: ATP-grasp domain-containing protein [Chloroflexi bacterium]|nr:ATP-grasp domain-containing protein [Chloroflexota bacterium]
MNPLTVLVTGVGGGGHGEQILKALRMAKTPYRIIGADMLPYVTKLKEVDEAYVLPAASHPTYVERLLEVCARQNVAAVFHGSEPELKVMSARRDEIQARGIFLPINPASVIDLCMDKVRTSEFLVAHGFDVPAYRRIRTPEDLSAFHILPAVLKPSVGGGGSANIFIAQNRRDLMCFGEYLLSLYPEFIAQEYVGTPDDEYTVGALVTMDGVLLNSIAVKRNILTSLSARIKVPNRSGRQDLGPVLAVSSGISQGIIGPFPDVTSPCEEIAAAIGCRGVLNIQCRFVRGRVLVFEINPRFSGTTSLRAMVGYNEPDVLIRTSLFGEEFAPHFAYGSGFIIRGLHETLLA